MVSTIKKCEDDNNVVVRLFDIEGMDSNISLWSFKPIKKAVKPISLKNLKKSLITRQIYCL